MACYDLKCGSCVHLDLHNYDWTSGYLCTYRDSRYPAEYDGNDKCSHYEYGRDSATAQYIIDHR